MWQPHAKVNTQKGKRVLSLGGLFCGARPPSLSGFLWGFSLFSALEVPRGDHTIRTRSSPWSITIVHHPKNWKETGIPQRAVQS